MFQYTMDSIMQIFFGEEADTLGDESCLYGDAFDQAHRAMSEYVQWNWDLLETMNLAIWPLGGYRGLLQRVQGWFNPDHQRLLKNVKILDAESARLVENSRSDPKLADRKDLIALFLQGETDGDFSTKYLRDMVLNFVIAGRDTTACLLSWALYILSTNPEVQARLVEEVDRVLPQGTDPSLKLVSASSMPYLHGVIYEALRLYPPVPNDQKAASVDDVTPDGIKVAKGTVVMVNVWAMGRDPTRWETPEEVKPERWIPFTAPAPHEFPVFQAGPRICLGVDMALFEAKLLLGRLFQRFTFELLAGEKEKITYANTITMSICNAPQQKSHQLLVVPTARTKA